MWDIQAEGRQRRCVVCSNKVDVEEEEEEEEAVRVSCFIQAAEENREKLFTQKTHPAAAVRRFKIDPGTNEQQEPSGSQRLDFMSVNRAHVRLHASALLLLLLLGRLLRLFYTVCSVTGFTNSHNILHSLSPHQTPVRFLRILFRDKVKTRLTR